MRRASAITMRSGFTTRRTLVRGGVGEQLPHPVEPVVEAAGGAEHLVAGHRQAVTRDRTGETTLLTRRPTGNSRSMYQARMSGRDRNRMVSAVGAQSTTMTSQSPESA